MAGAKRIGVLGVAALAGASAVQLPQLEQQVPLGSGDQNNLARPLVDSETLQANIDADKLLTHMKELYEIGKLGEDVKEWSLNGRYLKIVHENEEFAEQPSVQILQLGKAPIG